MVDKLLEDLASATTPFISLSGDFNEPSWLDWTADAQSAGIVPYVVQWPTTRSLWEGGMQGDAYRTIHPNPITHPDTHGHLSRARRIQKIVWISLFIPCRQIQW